MEIVDGKGCFGEVFGQLVGLVQMFSAPAQNSQYAKPGNDTLFDIPEEIASVTGNADHKAEENGGGKQAQQQSPILFEQFLDPIIAQQEITESKTGRKFRNAFSADFKNGSTE